MPLTLENPVTIPAKGFDILWIPEILIRTDPGAATVAKVTYTAVRNAGTAEAPVYESCNRVVEEYINDVYAEATNPESPIQAECAAALQALLTVANKAAVVRDVPGKLAAAAAGIEYVPPAPPAPPAPPEE
jgi:hypothetical protein